MVTLVSPLLSQSLMCDSLVYISSRNSSKFIKFNFLGEVELPS
jgi:hypothetical protein